MKIVLLGNGERFGELGCEKGGAVVVERWVRLDMKETQMLGLGIWPLPLLKVL